MAARLILPRTGAPASAFLLVAHEPDARWMKRLARARVARARQKRIRTKPLKFRDSGIRKQAITGPPKRLARIFSIGEARDKRAPVCGFMECSRQEGGTARAPTQIEVLRSSGAMGGGRVKSPYPDENEQSYCSWDSAPEIFARQGTAQ